MYIIYIQCNHEKNVPTRLGAHDVLVIHKISYYLYISYMLSDYIILSIPLLYYRLYIFYIYLYIYIYQTTNNCTSLTVPNM